MRKRKHEAWTWKEATPEQEIGRIGCSSGQETVQGVTGGSEKGEQGSSGAFHTYFSFHWYYKLWCVLRSRQTQCHHKETPYKT